MELISLHNVRVSSAISIPPITLSNRNFSFPFSTWACPSRGNRRKLCAVVTAKKSRKLPPQQEPVPKPTIAETEEVPSADNDDEEEDQLLFDEYELDDEALLEDVEDEGDFEDEYVEEEEALLQVGDGAGGGGIALAGTWWDKEALAIAEQVCLSFEGELGMYAFRTLPNSTIQVRIERLTNKSGSPKMEDVEAFCKTYRARLDEAELAKAIPENTALEVSSPGVERVVRIPEDLDRFKDRPMYVKYVSQAVETDDASESDGIFKLVSFDVEMKSCTWGVADAAILLGSCCFGDQ
ncbi:unnamed protein product [Linum trigynum]|uniref:Ribosome maturation factor RimP N-terminal domain-containing protein n=1 Tax=Linum trigynum TaxID=586398 RepID=A0AAV2D0Q1_9ROSI